MSGLKIILPEVRGVFCTWNCHQSTGTNEPPCYSQERCQVFPIEIFAMRKERAKGPDYTPHEVYPPFGEFKERSRK